MGLGYAERVKILLTNDDGIRAPGLIALYKQLATFATVVVVAPETVQSATGHGITLATPLLTQRVDVDGVFTGTAVDGRPADCVKLALNQILPELGFEPDVLVSGMNSGANVGINVIYSGTVAAAIEGAFLGLPAIAVSLHLRHQIRTDYDQGAAVALPVIRKLIAAEVVRGEVVNINVPATETGTPAASVATRVCRQCTRPWVDQYEKRLDPRGRAYYWNSSVFTLGETEADTDVAALRDGHVAVTPLMFDLTRGDRMGHWAGRLK